MPLAKQEVEDWSVASALPSVSHEARPYFFVKWGQDPHDLLLQTIIGRRQIFGGPSVPSGQNCIFPMRAGGCDDGISTLHSHQYSLTDEGVTEEIKRQTFSKHCFVPLHNKVLMRGLLDQQVRHCVVGLLAYTRSGDVGSFLTVRNLAFSTSSVLLSMMQTSVTRLCLPLPLI